MVAASVSRKQRLIEDLEAEFGADDRDRPQFEPLTLPQFIKGGMAHRRTRTGLPAQLAY
jgi:hypothetical protein